VTYFEGFIVPVPEDKKDAYRQMAAGGAPIFVHPPAAVARRVLS